MLYAQLACVILASLILLLLPSPRGPMMILPLPHAPTPFSWLRPDMNWRLVRGGQTPIVTGDRATILPAAIQHGAIVIAAAPWLCSSSQK